MQALEEKNSSSNTECTKTRSPKKPKEPRSSRKFWRINDICDELAFDRVRLWQLRKNDPDFPHPFVIGTTQMWDREDIFNYVTSKRQGDERAAA